MDVDSFGCGLLVAYVIYLAMEFHASLRDTRDPADPKPVNPFAPMKSSFQDQFMFGGILMMAFIVVRVFAG